MRWLLKPSAVRARAFTCDVPADSAIQAYLPGAYYYDCHAVDVAGVERSALGHFRAALAEAPSWVETLMALRNRLVRLVGLKDLGGLGAIDPGKEESAYRPGDRVGIFTLIANTDNEVLLGDNDMHLEVVLSVCKRTACDGRAVSVVVTTVVHVHNLLGRVYMLPVTPLHKIIAPAVISRLVK